MQIDIKLNPKQLLAVHKLADLETNEILYGWGARWGKTFLLVFQFLIWAISRPKSAYLIGRKELKRLKATTLLEFFEVAERYKLKQFYTYNAGDNVAEFTNGSRIFFANLERMPSDPNYDRLWWYSLTAIGIDEAQEIEKKAIDVLRWRLSVLSGPGWKCVPKMLYTCNPWKWWIRNDFWIPHRDGTMSGDKIFIPALVQDNPLIEQSYIDNLKKSDKVTVERLLHGNFDYDDSDTRLIPDDKLYALWGDHGTRGQRYMSCDIARMWGDRTVLMVWDGFAVEKIVSYQFETLDHTANKIKELATQYKIKASSIVIDADGLGAWVVDLVRGCREFHGGATSESYLNLKAECSYKLAELVNKGVVSLIDYTAHDYILEELTTLEALYIDSDRRPWIQNKEWQKEKLGRSPDYSDALLMRFFYEITPKKFIKIF